MFGRVTPVQRLVGRKRLGNAPREAWCRALGRPVDFVEDEQAARLGRSVDEALTLRVFLAERAGGRWEEVEVAKHRLAMKLIPGQPAFILDADSFLYVGAIPTTVDEVLERFEQLVNLPAWAVGSLEAGWSWVEVVARHGQTLVQIVVDDDEFDVP